MHLLYSCFLFLFLACIFLSLLALYFSVIFYSLFVFVYRYSLVSCEAWALNNLVKNCISTKFQVRYSSEPSFALTLPLYSGINTFKEADAIPSYYHINISFTSLVFFNILYLLRSIYQIIAQQPSRRYKDTLKPFHSHIFLYTEFFYCYVLIVSEVFWFCIIEEKPIKHFFCLILTTSLNLESLVAW